MISVKINVSEFEYDIHSLVKAFYPESEVKVSTEVDETVGEEEPFISIVMEPSELVMEVTMGRESHEERVRLPKVLNFSEGEERALYKNYLKKLIYKTLEYFSGKSLPWGTLTGIRPTKIPMELLVEGKSEDDIRKYMKETYLVSDEKTDLSIDIAKRELEILKDIDAEKGYSLYIGIPFCPTTCLYCSFTSFPIVSWKNKVDEYLDCVFKEIDYVAEAFKDKTLDSVYIGGGTPTTLEPEQFDRLFTKLRESLDLSHVKEFTVEAGRADSITREKLEALKRNGVTRISVNPQTMNEETLKFIGRRATAAETVEAYKLAREVGLDNINMDIILGLPGEGEEDVKRTIDIIKELKPDSLTVHSLAVKRASRLSQWIEENGMSMINNTDATMEIAAKGAEDLGLKPYYLYRQKNMSGNLENVGFASEGKYGIYNILIMEELQSIVALGAGTVSKRVYGNGRIERCDNVKDVKLYMEQIDEMIDRKRRLYEAE